jgi:hypothetical protein
MNSTIETEIKNQTFSTFRTLLRKGIGSRSQAEFAKEVGLSRVTLNRMLNNDTIPRPSRDQLFLFSQHMFSITYQDLLRSCGYDLGDIHDIAKKNIDCLTKTLSHAMGVVLSEPGDLTSWLQQEYDGTPGTFHISYPINSVPPMNPAVDKTVCFLLIWKLSPYVGTTYFTVGFTKTAAGAYVVTGFLAGKKMSPYIERMQERSDSLNLSDSYEELDPETGTTLRDVVKHPYPIRSSLSPEERLLQSIFGPSRKNCLIHTIPGFGFSIENIDPEKMRAFLLENQAVLCDKKEHQTLIERLADGEDPEVVFREFKNTDLDGTESEAEKRKIISSGSGAAAAYILTRISGTTFHCLEDKDRTILFCPLGDIDVPEDLLYSVYMAARSLSVPTFGRILYNTYTPFHRIREQYHLSDFHYEWVDHSENEQE